MHFILDQIPNWHCATAQHRIEMKDLSHDCQVQRRLQINAGDGFVMRFFWTSQPDGCCRPRTISVYVCMESVNAFNMIEIKYI